MECQTSNPAQCLVEYGFGDSLAHSTPEEPDPIVYHWFDLDGLIPGASHVYRVTATDVFGQTVASDVATFETLPVEIQIPPSITELAVHGVSATTARLAWTTDRPATSEVQYGLSPDYSSSVYDPAMTTDHEVVLTGLDLESLYHYRVASEDSDGLRTQTDDDTFSIINADDGMPPATPEVPEVACEDGGLRISLPHSPDPSVVAHRVYRRVESDLFYEMIAQIPTSEVSYVDDTTVDGVAYEYTVSVIDLWGVESDRSAPIGVVAGAGEYVRMWVFPNPVRESATLRIAAPLSATRGGPWDYTVRIYDAAGRLTRTLSGHGVQDAVKSVSWNTRNERGKGVASGVYFCEVEAAGSVARTKLIVIR